MDLNPPQIPFLSVGGDFEKAILKIVVPEVDEPEIPLKFNPTSYQLQKANTFSEIEIPGLETPPIQYIRGGNETLRFDALFDTSDSQKNVREEYVDKVANLMRINSELHAPPIVQFVWETEIFQGVVSDMSVSYVLFTPKGIPMRAEVSLTLTAYRPVEVQIAERPRNSPDVEKSVTLRRGDRLDQIASGVYQDPARWRDIARSNGIRDPRRLVPGALLLVPRISRGRGQA
ncbi:LysM domain-containing protein [Paracoccus liaowanqingii]|uniref:LysM domain-containing protein n=1 Tax=Paracoccus liaowanqingii TaxID=2560053 RepID=A0A4P7HN49_9RHOB|nr:LysM domain-containing protein [Paracoccus liaowanqingii]QBX35170.1 LysM domain-containing protein [Paracoccus liaowanqingii]